MFDINDTTIANEKIQKSINSILEKRIEALQKIRELEENRHQQVVSDFLEELDKEVQAHPLHNTYKIKTYEPQLVNWLHTYAQNTNIEYECIDNDDYSLSIIVNIH